MTDPERQCTRCSAVKLLDAEHFIPHPQCPLGLTRICRTCDNKARRKQKRAKRIAAGLPVGHHTKDPGKGVCKQCYNLPDRRPRIGTCKCGLRWQAEPAVEPILRRSRG